MPRKCSKEGILQQELVEVHLIIFVKLPAYEFATISAQLHVSKERLVP